jgi:hypothetical protein
MPSDWVGEARRVFLPLAMRVGGGFVRVDAHTVGRMDECPARAGFSDWTGWDAAKARRQLTLAVLHRHKDGTTDLAAAALDVADELAAEGNAGAARPRVGDWLASLDRAGRAMAAREAGWWAAAVAGSLTRPLGRSQVITDGSVRWQPDRDTGLTLTAPLDVVRGGLLLVSAAGPPGPSDRHRAGAAALLWALLRREAAEVVVVHPTSRVRVRMRVDEALLQESFDAYAAAATALVQAAIGAEPAARLPGRWCGGCPLLADCPEGQDWCATHPRWVGGLPLRA